MTHAYLHRRARFNGPGKRRHQRHGIIFIVALGIIVVLAAMVLVFAQNMRTEATAAGNRTTYAQADAIELGTEAWVQGQVESYQGQASYLTTETPAMGIQIGDGYFWLIRPMGTTDKTQDYGLIDESGKVNLNTAAAASLALLPNMPQDTSDSIVTWRGGADGNGAQSNYYSSLNPGYTLKAAPFETVEEVLLVQDMTKQYLYGLDLNRDGIVDDVERDSAKGWSNFDSSVEGSRGLFNYLTVYSAEPNTTLAGHPRLNVSVINRTSIAALETLLSNSLSATRADEIGAAVVGQAFTSLGAFYTASGMTPSEWGLVEDKLTTSTAANLRGLIDVNTAPASVLATLPGLALADAQSIVAARASADTTSLTWVWSLPIQNVAGLAGTITGRSFQYSADIVAVSGDGRSFKRVRIVVDSRQIPSTIVYRKDLTSLGWPLPQAWRDSLRAGKGLTEEMTTQPPTGNTLFQ